MLVFSEADGGLHGVRGSIGDDRRVVYHVAGEVVIGVEDAADLRPQGVLFNCKAICISSNKYR